MGLTLPLGARSSAFMQADRRGFSGEVRRMPPTDRGWGYRLALGTGDIERQQADLNWRGPAGDYTLQAARYDDATAMRFLASGGIVWVDGQTMLGRRLGDAMAIVKVPGQADVRVYDENRLVGRTNKDGVAIVTGLRPYTSNSLSISAADIAFDYQLNLTALTVVPRAHGAAVALFDIPHTRSATFVLEMPDGSPVTSGTTILVADSEQRLFAGYGGEVFISDMKPGMQIIAQTPQGECAATLTGSSSDASSETGPFRCKLTREGSDAQHHL
jgi:outer membrane usher protein